MFHAEGEDPKNEKSNENYNPWPHYTFSGKLRPFPKSAKREVPSLIPRPDYADHPQGRSLSEESFRGKYINISDQVASFDV